MGWYRMLICSVAGFPAKICPLPEEATGSKGRAPGCGSNTSGSSRRSRRVSSSSKTCSDCARVDCEQCWPALPISGSMQNGRVSQSEKIRREPTGVCISTGRMNGNAYSSLLPTPSASSYGSNRGGSAGRVGRVRHSLSALARGGLLPTPTVKGNHNKAGLSARSGDGLATAVGGPLSARFVEWMMGFPIDHTDVG